jgi:hypothetical protein
MRRILLIISFFFSITVLWGETIFAGGVAQFGTVSKSKITLNPAGAAAIDRILADFTLFNYQGENRYAPFTSQMRRFGSPASLYHKNNLGFYDEIDSVDYDAGDITGLHVDIAYPTSFFTVGIGYDDRNEQYDEGSYTLYNGSTVSTFDDGSSIPDIEATYRRQTTSLLLAIPLKGFSIGFRQNYRQVVHTIDKLSGLYLYYDDYGTFSTFPTINSFDSDGMIKGTSNYQFNEYGMMFVLSGFQPRLDLGLLYRPPVDSILEFENQTIGLDETMQDLPFTEPGLRLVTISGEIASGRGKVNLVLEAGNFTDTERSLEAIISPGESTRDRSYDVQGYLLRLAYNPFFEIAYGVRSREIAGSLTEIITKLIKVPVPFIDGLVVTLGAQDILIKDYLDEVVAQSTSYTFATEVKFGKPVTGPGRTGGSIASSGLPPKTKRLPYYMEF